jgi:hypothetical protein
VTTLFPRLSFPFGSQTCLATCQMYSSIAVKQRRNWRFFILMQKSGFLLIQNENCEVKWYKKFIFGSDTKNLKRRRATFYFKAKKCNFSSRFEAKITLSLKRNEKFDAKRSKKCVRFIRLSARIESETDPISLLAANFFTAEATSVHPSSVCTNE